MVQFTVHYLLAVMSALSVEKHRVQIYLLSSLSNRETEGGRETEREGGRQRGGEKEE